MKEPAIAGRFFPAGRRHRHRCVTKDCGRSYPCTNNCDIGSLNDSVCPGCFELAAFA